MGKTLAFKELRENAWIAAAALAAYALLVLSYTGWDLGLVHRLPLISSKARLSTTPAPVRFNSYREPAPT